MILNRVASSVAVQQLFRNASGRSGTFQKVLQTQVEDIKTSGLYKKERIITSPQTNNIMVKGKKVLNCMYMIPII